MINKENTQASTIQERFILVILSVLLLAGATVLYLRHSRPLNKITIIEQGIKEQLTLKQVEEALKEKSMVDINIAEIEELASVPGIGPTLSVRIVKYRDACGPFYNKNDLLDVPGIGRKKLEKITEYIKIE